MVQRLAPSSNKLSEISPSILPMLPRVIGHQLDLVHLVKYLFEQRFLHTGSRVRAFKNTCHLITQRFFDSCLLEGIPSNEFERKIHEIVLLVNENMPCIGSTDEFPGVGKVFCEVNGPASIHGNMQPHHDQL